MSGPGRTQLDSLPLHGRRQRPLRPLADLLRFLFGRGDQDMDREPVAVLIIEAGEVHATLHQKREKPGVSPEAAQLGDHQGRPVAAALFDGFHQAGPLPLSLDEFGDQRAIVEIDELRHRRPIGVPIVVGNILDFVSLGIHNKLHHCPGLCTSTASIHHVQGKVKWK